MLPTALTVLVPLLPLRLPVPTPVLSFPVARLPMPPLGVHFLVVPGRHPYRLALIRHYLHAEQAAFAARGNSVRRLLPGLFQVLTLFVATLVVLLPAVVPLLQVARHLAV